MWCDGGRNGGTGPRLSDGSPDASAKPRSSRNWRRRACHVPAGQPSVQMDADARFCLWKKSPAPSTCASTCVTPHCHHKRRRRWRDELGRLIAAYHDAGFTTPELSAKHVLVLPQTRELVLIDWQSARCVATVKLADRVRALAALHASLATILATPSERVRVLRKAIGTHGAADSPRVRFSDVVRRVLVESGRIAGRRSIRDQRQATSPASQRLVWLVGEAVCAVPEIAATWPSPAEAAPFYGREPGSFSIRLGDGRAAMLLRGRSYTPFSRLYAWVRGRPWRSPGATLGRVLFHLERYGIPRRPCSPSVSDSRAGQAQTGSRCIRRRPRRLRTQSIRTSPVKSARNCVNSTMRDAACSVIRWRLSAFEKEPFPSATCSVFALQNRTRYANFSDCSRHFLPRYVTRPGWDTRRGTFRERR